MENDKSMMPVPKREFGNSGVKISKLCLGGGSFGIGDPQLVLEKALRLGVDCWEMCSFTGNVYRDYFHKNPGSRERVFLSGKVFSTAPDIMEEQLNKALEDNEIEIIDFLAVHQISDITNLNEGVRKWVEKAKREKKIRFFGFCTHKNMANCLAGACRLGWIDGIQTVYNYRTRNIEGMEDAIKKCNEEGIGLFAVKSMGFSVQRKEESQKLSIKAHLDSLLSECDMSFEQLKMKSIWDNPHITSICSLMPSLSILESNVSAAIDENPNNYDIKRSLIEYAETTGKYYCSRCGKCDTTNTNQTDIFGIMEMLMYSRKYGLQEIMTKNFSQIPDEIQKNIPKSDYSNAEKFCPQKMLITQIMKEAYSEFHQD